MTDEFDTPPEEIAAIVRDGKPLSFASAGPTTVTHVTVYDASDRHGILFDGERILGCECGFSCEEWDFEGDGLVTHLRSLGQRWGKTIEIRSDAGPETASEQD